MRNTFGDTKWLPANQRIHLKNSLIIEGGKGFAKKTRKVVRFAVDMPKVASRFVDLRNNGFRELERPISAP